MESPCEFGIEPPGSISHGVSYVWKLEKTRKEELLGDGQGKRKCSVDRSVKLGSKTDVIKIARWPCIPVSWISIKCNVTFYAPFLKERMPSSNILTFRVMLNCSSRSTSINYILICYCHYDYTSLSRPFLLSFLNMLDEKF